MHLLHYLRANDPSANANGQVRSHRFPGTNTFLPILLNDQKQLDTAVSFMLEGKMRISIDEASREDSIQTLHALDESIRNTQEAPYYYYLGETAELDIVVSNRGVGHDFPGGAIDLNQAWIEFLVINAEGQTVYDSGLVDKDNCVDPTAYFYRALAVDRNGALVWRHDLFNMVGESFRRVIKPKNSS